MSDAAQGPGWWQAADGRWYPPRPADDPPAPGWWLAADGRWYPPRPADSPPAPGWWLAADGRWYPPAGNGQASPGPAAGEARPAGAGRPVKKVVKKKVVKKVVKKAATAHPAEAPAATAAAGPSEGAAQDAGGPRLTTRTIPMPGDSIEQIARQRQASRDDAEQLATARYAAAMKALSRATADDEDTPSADPVPPAATAASAEPARPQSAPAERPPPQDAAPAPDAVSIQHPDRPLLDESPVILELKMSALGADIDHIGDRLLIRSNRIELRDRGDHVRRSTSVDGVLGVHLSKKLTGAVLTVTSSECEEIVAKGVRPDLADEAQTLIGRLAPHILDDPNRAPPARSGGRVDEQALLGKLSDLYQAGVLTTMEYEEKRELVARLARAEQFSSVSP